MTERGGHKRFIVANHGMPKDLNNQVTLWIEKNVGVHNITSIMKNNKLEADNLQ